MTTIEELRLCEVLAGLTDDELQQIIPFCHEERCPKDRIVFSEGDEAATFYILQEGKISLQYVICPQPDYCQDATILLDKPGDFMGWSSLVKPRRMTASGYCITDVRLIAVDGKQLSDLMERDSHIGFVILKVMAGQLNKRLREAKGLTFQRIMGAL